MEIKQVWDTLTQEQRSTVLVELVEEGVAMSTAYCYCNGNRRPKKPYRRAICKGLKKATGKEFTAEELFPWIKK